MPLYLSTSCVDDVNTSCEALGVLETWGWQHAQLGQGRPRGRDWLPISNRWGGRLLLHGAFLEPPELPRWNLASEDRDWRHRAVTAASDSLRYAADLGSPYYSLHAGQALELGLDPQGRPVGRECSRVKALDRLVGSLDRLATLADKLGIGLLLENPSGGPAPDPASFALGQGSAELIQTFERVGAPNMGVQLDVAHWLLACGARRMEPELALIELAPWVRTIEISGVVGKTDGHGLPREDGTEVALARAVGGLALPVIFEPRGFSKADVLACATMLQQALALLPGPTVMPSR